MADVNDLKQWFERDVRYARWDDSVQMYFEGLEGSEKTVRIALYTDTNKYMISAVTGPEAERNYLGCIAWARKPRAGEEYGRGNDLPDGPLTEQTWYAILAAIVGYELVKVHKKAEPVAAVPTPQLQEA